MIFQAKTTMSISMSMFQQLSKKLNKRASKHESKEPRFILDPETGIPRRFYDSYEDYLDHQREKLHKKKDSILEYDKEYETIVCERYGSVCDWRGKSIICLAARLGGEVRAFKTLGALAIGIDVEPGSMNCHVLHGDFHNVQFPDSTFDAAFTNAIDHVYNLTSFLREVHRLLKDGGYFYVELCKVSPARYEALDTSNSKPVIETIQRFFHVESSDEVFNKTSFVEWSGSMLKLRRKSAL